MTKSVVVLGVLDGVHLGHQKLLSTAIDLASQHDAKVVVVSFDPHPNSVLQNSQVELICSVAERKRLLIEHGVDQVEILDFNLSRMHQLPAEFIKEILLDKLNAIAVVVGEGYRFGYKAQGTAADIAAAGIHTEVVPHQEFREGRISSTRIRQAIKSGELPDAAMMLGRPFSLSGEVGYGDQRGRTLGYPTANLILAPDQIRPKPGVYAGFAEHDGGLYRAAISVGVNLTFGGIEPRVEAYLIDQDLNLYGSWLTLWFIEYLRPMLAFSGEAELIVQMKQDVVKANSVLAANLPPGSSRN